MIRQATLSEREEIIRILSASFDANPAVNDTVPVGAGREKRMRALMEYLVDTAYSKQGAYITDDKLGAFLMYDPVAHPNSLSDKLRQLKLVHRCIGWSRMRYASAKDKRMRSFRPTSSHFYLSMIGTSPDAQGKGIGSKMISYLQGLSAAQSKTIYLETSVLKNVEMYKRKGFVVHGDWKIRDDYHVHFMNWSK